jgi:hypothetical protein
MERASALTHGRLIQPALTLPLTRSGLRPSLPLPLPPRRSGRPLRKYGEGEREEEADATATASEGEGAGEDATESVICDCRY